MRLTLALASVSRAPASRIIVAIASCLAVACGSTTDPPPEAADTSTADAGVIPDASSSAPDSSSAPEASVTDAAGSPDSNDTTSPSSDATTPDTTPVQPAPVALPSAAQGPCAFEGAAPATTTDNPNCPDGTYRGETQTVDLKALRSCTRVTGSLRLDSTRNIEQLEALRVIDGDLELLSRCGNGNCNYSEAPEFVHGLGNLRCVGGDMHLGRADKPIADVDGLAQLVEVGGIFEVHAKSVEAPDRFKALQRVWGDLISEPVLPLPALETIYGKLAPTPYDSQTWHDPTPRLTYIGCDAAQVPCRDGFLGCSFEALNQADVNRLAACEKAHQSLKLVGNEIADLSPLRHLAVIRQDLVIGPDLGGAAKLKSLAGLDALRAARSLTIHNLPDLEDLHALHSLNTLPSGDLTIEHVGKIRDLSGLGSAPWAMLTLSDNASLSSLDGVYASPSAGTLAITNSPELLSIGALAAVQNLASINLQALPKLADLRGLSQLRNIGLQITACNSLRDLTGLDGAEVTSLGLNDNAGLRSTAGWHGQLSAVSIVVANSPLLTSLQGLFDTQRNQVYELTLTDLPALSDLHDVSAAESMDQLSLTRCDGLANLAGLDHLSTLRILTVKDNAQIKDLSGTSVLHNISQLIVDGNPMLAHLTGTVLAPALQLLRIANTTQLRDLTGLESLTQAPVLEIVNNAALTSLHGLSGLRSAGGGESTSIAQESVIIDHNPVLLSLDGFDALEQAHGFEVTGNAALERFGSFPKLTSLGWLRFRDNPRLTSLNGLPALDGTLYYLELRNNAQLSSLAGLERARQVGGVSIADNAALVDLVGLRIESVTGSLEVAGNPLLTSLNGFETLQSIATELNVIGNPRLISLGGLSGLSSGPLWFNFKNNTTLTECELERLLQRFPNSSRMLENNGPPCTTP
jgi:hypothetical protein